MTRTGHPVSVGPVTALLDGPVLRRLRLSGAEALSSIYVAVRDRNWGTVPGQVLSYAVDADGSGFLAGFHCLHENAEVAFTWDGEVAVAWSSEKRVEVVFAMRGMAEREFLGNRLGFCLLHPLALCGVEVEALAPAGRHVAPFPVGISPHQPFIDLVGMAYPLAGTGRVEIRFEGDLFETEDQRNWSDASFKTYCTPLRLAYPRRFAKGEEVAQRVVVALDVPDIAPSSVAVPPGAVTSTHIGLSTDIGLSTGTRCREAIEVDVGAPGVARLPVIGVGCASSAVTPDSRSLARIAQLGLAHLHVLLDPAEANWQEGLDRAAWQARTFGVTLDVEAVLDGPGDLEEVASALARAFGEGGAAKTETEGKSEQGGAPLGRVSLFERQSSVTSRPLAEAWHSLAARLGLPSRPAGGSRANFAELNRAELPLELLEAVTYAVNPQVHVTDDESVMETLATYPMMACRARQLAVGRPVVVGPITLRPRFNPYGTGPPIPTADEALPEDADGRQPSLFTAAWTLGSLAALAGSGVEAATYFETIGMRGLLAGADALPPAFPALPGAVFPVYHVLATVAPLGGNPVAPVAASIPGQVGALAVVRGADLTVAVANLTPAQMAVTVRAPFADQPVARLLDAAAAHASLADGADTLARRVVTENVFELGSYEVLFLEGPSSHRASVHQGGAL